MLSFSPYKGYLQTDGGFRNRLASCRDSISMFRFFTYTFYKTSGGSWWLKRSARFINKL